MRKIPKMLVLMALIASGVSAEESYHPKLSCWNDEIEKMIVGIMNKEAIKAKKEAKEQVKIYNQELKEVVKKPGYYEGNSEERKIKTQIELWTKQIKGAEKWKDFKPEFTDIKIEKKEEYRFKCRAEPNYKTESMAKLSLQWTHGAQYWVEIDKNTGKLKILYDLYSSNGQFLPYWIALADEE